MLWAMLRGCGRPARWCVHRCSPRSALRRYQTSDMRRKRPPYVPSIATCTYVSACSVRADRATPCRTDRSGLPSRERPRRRACASSRDGSLASRAGQPFASGQPECGLRTREGMRPVANRRNSTSACSHVRNLHSAQFYGDCASTLNGRPKPRAQASSCNISTFTSLIVNMSENTEYVHLKLNIGPRCRWSRSSRPVTRTTKPPNRLTERRQVTEPPGDPGHAERRMATSPSRPVTWTTRLARGSVARSPDRENRAMRTGDLDRGRMEGERGEKRGEMLVARSQDLFKILISVRIAKL
jgi:hypothetical protein